MKTLKNFIESLREDAPANSVGLPSGVSPPSATNNTSTNIAFKLNKTKKPLRRNIK